HAEFTRDLLYVNGATLVDEAGVSGDDKKRLAARQHRDDVLGDAIGKVFLFRVAGHILEGKHGDRRFVGKGEGRSRRQYRGDGRGIQAVDAYWACDVLEDPRTEVSKFKRQLVMNLVVCGTGNANAPGFGNTLKARCNVDAVAVDTRI